MIVPTIFRNTYTDGTPNWQIHGIRGGKVAKFCCTTYLAEPPPSEIERLRIKWNSCPLSWASRCA